MEFTELIAMSKSRKRPLVGDVFVVQPILNTYYYGKVIKTNMVSSNRAINGMNLIFIYNHSSTKKLDVETEKLNELLIPPFIINFQPWLKGYFETVGNFEINDIDRGFDYGFNYRGTRRFVDEDFNVLDHEPKYWDDYGLSGFMGVGERIQNAIMKK